MTEAQLVISFASESVRKIVWLLSVFASNFSSMSPAVKSSHMMLFKGSELSDAI